MKGNTWNIWGASVTGPMHLDLGLPNQDSWMSRHYSWGEVVAVSDGLGSRPRSEVGSQAACLSVFEAAKAYRRNPEAGVEDILRLVHSHWLVKIAPYEPSECSATCLFVIRTNGNCLLAQLGDGLIAAYGTDSRESILLIDRKQDSFSNLTHSLGNRFKPNQWQCRTVAAESFKAFVLCTDGISDDLIIDRQIDFTRELYLTYSECGYQKRTHEVYRWLKDWPVPGHSDDKTIACLFRKERHPNNEL